MSSASSAKKFRRGLFWGAALVTSLLGAAKLGGADIALWAVFIPIYVWFGIRTAATLILGFLVAIYIRANAVGELTKILDGAAEKRRR
ncbi:hypothetical protein SEA_SPEEDDEMON_1140 [Gordonia phage SpeedDemon]|nr:hypothetical protein SEA_SPEEDDEMON_1140 [Gordonia phage SpeedDemon]